MRYLIIVVAALALGVYSTVGLHYYSILASRTKSEWLRLAFSIPTIALFILLPMIGCMFLLGVGPNPSSKEMRGAWLLAVFLSWIGTGWAYVIKNWKVLNTRLRSGSPSRLTSRCS